MTKIITFEDKEKAKNDFQIRVDTYTNTILDKDLGNYKQYVIVVNGFIWASYVDEQLFIASKAWIEKYGFRHIKKNLVEIIRRQWQTGQVSGNKNKQ